MKTNASEQTLLSALEKTNRENGFQLKFNRFDVGKKVINFTIKTISGVMGAKVNPLSGKNIASACWYAHGYLFENIFDLEPDAYINSLGQKINKDTVWDYNPVIYPMYGIRLSDCSYAG